ncbi:MAG: S8 family serine peptidase, partial [Flavisolibacter sp.]
MKINRYLLFIIILLNAQILHAQDYKIYLSSGTVDPQPNITKKLVDSFNVRTSRVRNHSFLIIQFESIPGEQVKTFLSSHGIELLEYIPSHAYTASVTGNLDPEILQQVNARSFFSLMPQQKMERRLSKGMIPFSAVKLPGTIDVWISFPKTFLQQDVLNELKNFNADIISTDMVKYRIIAVRISTSRLNDLAALPFIEYVQPAPGGDQLLNYNSRYASRANLLNASIADGGKGLNGEGMVVGVGDNADVQTHIDFARRLINRAAQPTTSGHGHHTTGSVAGAGNGSELYRGYAPKATIVSQAFNGIIINAPTYVNDYGMVITNNSYGDNIECGYYGTYDLYSRMLDQMAIDYPSLQNVFSAGNSGLNTCSPFLPSYHTVLGGYQSAKNVITVGATNDSGAIASFSSRGPVKDGRVKPEIVAMGQFVASAWAANIYGYNNGTSMSGPMVSGGLTLLYQRYKQLNGGVNPKNGLMKAIICNGAVDRGNAGPDYQYGFGWMNLLRSIDMIENSRYFISSAVNSTTNTHTISVPVNTARLKVMLYWNDPAASVLSSPTLVNDLDLEVADPSSTIFLPKILDTSSANVTNASVTGADHLNNMEQVVFENPVAGNYTLRVKGTAITKNPSQEYFLVYDIIPVQLKITAPAGSEDLAPSTNAFDMMKISWEADGFPSSGTATIEFSPDNGSTWSTVAAGVNINRYVYTWWVPNIPTSQALVRVTKDGTGETSTSNPFTILGQPVISLPAPQCEGYINMSWAAIPSATDYEVMMLQGDDMKRVALTTGTSYTFSGLSKDSTYSVTVRARINGKPGRRADAITTQPNTGTCSGTISDNDLKVDAILAPASGRKFTSTSLTASTVISARIRNLDDAPSGSFDVEYSINGGPFVSEIVATPIAAGGSYTHNFATTADMSAPGNYDLTVVVKNSNADPVSVNDTLYARIKQLDNQPLNLASFYVDDMEAATVSDYVRDTVGITGIDRYDFSHSTPYGRLRTFVNSGYAYSGSKALTLDASRYYIPGNTNYLVGTYNLSGYNASSNDVRIDFRFNHHGQQAHPDNAVWIRANDSQPWIQVYKLDANQADPGIYLKSTSIELSDILAAAAQNFGTSFQVRWGQFGQIATTDKTTAAGYTFDDIRVYEVFNDMQMQSIDEPGASSCGLTNSTQVKITVRNSDNNTINNIPVKYRIDNGSWITENIPSIAGNTSMQYTFVTSADLSTLGSHVIQAIVDLSADSFHENDTTSVTIMNTPVISSFPYLQNFESGNGYWYSSGIHSSWEYGTPSSTKLKNAASGIKAWKTRLAGNYNDNELSYLYSPCFDITGMTNPSLSFSVSLDLEDCGAALCDAAWVEYSADGITWTKLGASGTGTNWYNKSSTQLWSVQDYTRWHVATTPLPTGFSKLRLRFVMQSDAGVNREGISIDDIHVYDNTSGIYNGSTITSPLSQTVSGNSWIDFKSGGQLVASIQPNNQNLGATDVQAFINSSAVR